jgi:hypothetical protein
MDGMKKATTYDENRQKREQGGTATSFNSGPSALGHDTSGKDGSKNLSKKQKLRKGESYELDEDMKGLPTDLDRAAGPVQPREDTWDGEQEKIKNQNEKAPSESSELDSAEEEERMRKVKQILNRGFNKNKGEDKEEEERLARLMEENNIDPLENLVEGIFIFASGSTCQLPVDEETYNGKFSTIDRALLNATPDS